MIDEGMWNRLLEQREELLAEVKRLREENEMLREELKNDDTGIKAIDGLLKAVGDRNEEVKRLREENHILRMADWEYERVWDWLMENADHTCRKLLLLIEEWKEEDGLITIDGMTYKKEMIE